MCGPSSAIGLLPEERERWLLVKDDLREPGRFPGLMRGFLADKEVAAVISSAADGRVQPVAVLVSPEIREELDLPPDGDGWLQAGIGDYPVEVYVARAGGGAEGIAVRMTPWMNEYLVLYTRKLWSSRR